MGSEMEPQKRIKYFKMIVKILPSYDLSKRFLYEVVRIPPKGKKEWRIKNL